MANMAKFMVGFLTAFVMLCMPVLAGDRAYANILGYSADLRYFAFEEFGVQDGSGFAYSSYYIVDLQEDRWVVGTPVRAVAEDDNTSLTTIRARTAEEIAPRLRNLAVEVPAQILSSNGDGEPGNDGQSLTFGIPLYTGPDDVVGAYSLTLSPTKVAAGAPCIDWFGEEAIGFSLTIEDYGVKREVHKDTTLPRSRGCPMAYRITSVYAPFQATDISRTVALISVFVYGFEGPDRRFVIVPLAYSAQGL